jgi:acetyl esterase/lipase
MTPDKAMQELLRARPEVADAFRKLVAGVQASATSDITKIVGNLMEVYAGAANPVAASRDVEITEVLAGGVKSQFYVPTSGNRSNARILYIHGGAWCGGTLSGYRALAATLARQSATAVLLIDYRLAPEHQVPDGLNDCIAAYEWLLQNGPQGCTVAKRIPIAGDSAGGNLAAALTIRRITEGQSPPSRLALIAGTLDLGVSSYVARHDPLAGPESTPLTLQVYAPGPDSTSDPLINPMAASDPVLESFPPTLLQASNDEYLMGSSESFARRLIASGVRTVLSGWPLMPHVWHNFLDTIPEARAALSEVASFLGAADSS